MPRRDELFAAPHRTGLGEEREERRRRGCSSDGAASRVGTSGVAAKMRFGCNSDWLYYLDGAAADSTIKEARSAWDGELPRWLMGESDQWEGRGGPKSTAAGMPRAGRIHQESTACSWNSDGGWVERGGEVVEKYMGWDRWFACLTFCWGCGVENPREEWHGRRRTRAGNLLAAGDCLGWKDRRATKPWLPCTGVITAIDGLAGSLCDPADLRQPFPERPGGSANDCAEVGPRRLFQQPDCRVQGPGLAVSAATRT
ncbi:hypothetical protein BKA61DRAFT_578819 [Leptodontidium sp. MPI-SDFR-AT-0119]|nr:hypothetical protein BKA61DRAFT_578819 [Leptodontidium sp. MPI-SDFR-AT-0119]